MVSSYSYSRSYSRSYSPVPPPCPSPQLNPQPLPTPPIYAARRPSLSTSQELVPPKLKLKPSAAASSDSLVFSLKDAVVFGSPSARRFPEKPYYRQPSSSDYSLDRRPRTADVDRSVTSLTSSTSSPAKRKHRQSDSITQSSSEHSLPLPASRSLSGKRTRSPSGRHIQSETPPPVPPLPPLPKQRGGMGSASFLSPKKLPPIRIPELGLGLDEKLRSPLSPLFLCNHFRRRASHSKESEATSFLHMSPPKKVSSRRSAGRISLDGPLTGCVCVRATHSLPDINAVKSRSNPSFTSRIFRLGTQQVVH